MVFCSKCGKQSNPNDIFCNDCGNVLMDKKYFNLNKLENFREIVNKRNFNILKENPLSEFEYAIILKNIEEIGKDYLDDLEWEFKNRSTLGKIKLLTLSYADVSYKSKGAELGSYSFNRIEVDDRLNECDVIATLIHELSHHLFNEILEQMLMYIFEVEKSDALEAYVSFTLGTNMLYVLVNEYCAHTVEGRFIPHGYQNYGSFNKILIENFDLRNDRGTIGFALILGNSIADDIIHILENFITYPIRNEIKEIFKRDYVRPPSYDEILLEKKETFSIDQKLMHLHNMLMSGFMIADKDDAEEVFNIFEDGYISNNS